MAGYGSPPAVDRANHPNRYIPSRPLAFLHPLAAMRPPDPRFARPTVVAPQAPAVPAWIDPNTRNISTLGGRQLRLFDDANYETTTAERNQMMRSGGGPGQEMRDYFAGGDFYGRGYGNRTMMG